MIYSTKEHYSCLEYLHKPLTLYINILIQLIVYEIFLYFKMQIYAINKLDYILYTIENIIN